MKQKHNSLRWILLAAGIVAILGLTGMNIYSMYALRESAIESERENRKLQVAEFADKVRHRFFKSFHELVSMDMEYIQNTLESEKRFPEEAVNILSAASKDSIFQGIYFLPDNSKACRDGNYAPILKFDPHSQSFIESRNYPEVICDGMGIARTRMKVLISDYHYNNKILFDTHRSMTIALVNLTDRSVIGYLTMPINQQYMIDRYLQPLLKEKFGPSTNSGIIVWLRDWTKDKMIAFSDPSAEYDRSNIQVTQRFPDFFDDWILSVALIKTPSTVWDASLIKNMVVLVLTVLLLLGALVFMFITAQQERLLAERQAGFLANVTHELKTPLAVMQAAGENLADGRVKDKERLKSYGTHIFNESIRLRKMIEKLLDVARADAHSSLIEPKPVLLNELLEGYLADHRPYIENRGFTLETSIARQLPVTMIDTGSFETILGNLIENAIKYSGDKKYIHTSLSHQDKHVLLSIEDHGLGIPKKSINHIFEKFYRVEDALTAHTKGHGLGLSIVKYLVEQNGGSIQVESEEGVGTTFFVAFPTFMESGDQPEKTSASTPVYQTSKLTPDSPNYVG